MAQEPDKAFPTASRRRFGEGWSLRLPDCTQASREPTDYERAYEDPVPAGLTRPKRIKKWTFYKRDEARIRQIKKTILAKV